MLILNGWNSTNIIYAQTPVEILCDTSFEKFQTIRPLPETLYRVTVLENEQTVYQLERITPLEIQLYNIPVPVEFYGKINPYRPKISPDGRYLAFEPFGTGTAILVWKIGTLEITSLPLSTEEARYLIDTGTPLVLRERHLIWTDSTHLLIQYFNRESNRFDQLSAQKTLTVMESPLQIETGTHTEIIYPDLIPPSPSSFPQFIFSPQHTYITLLSEWIYNRLQIYDTYTEQLLADFQSDTTRAIVSDAIWTSDESRFFMMYQMNPATVPLRFNVIEVDVNGEFQLNDRLRQSLEMSFGSDLTFVDNSRPLPSPSGQKLAAQIYVPSQQTYYLVIEQLDTGEIKAICDRRHSEASYVFWGPNDNYFGYWDGGWVIAYNLSTGETYGMQASGFAGWLPTMTIEITPTPYSTATPTNIPTSTATIDPTATYTPTIAPTETPTATQSLTPTPAPDAAILFTSERDGNHEIYSMAADGSNVVRLTNSSGIDFYPTWFPDHSKIAFASTRNGNLDVYTMLADGSTVTQLTTSGGDDYGAQVSPDGTQMLFVSSRDGNLEIYRMNADGTNQTRLTDASGVDSFPDW